MATPTAAPSEFIEETDGDVTYIRTDKDLPPVAIIDRSPITVRHRIIFAIIAVLGAVAWAVIAFFRGETVNAVWFVIAATCTYVIGFRFYARLIEMKVVRPRDDYATPAEVFENATDYMPMDRRVLYGHHFAAIAGAGPLVGPVLAMQMGYLPGTIWIIIGAVAAGCVQDFLTLSISSRRRGPVAGPNGARRARRRRRRRRHHRDLDHHDDPACSPRPGGGAGPGGKPVGCLLDRDDDSDRHLHGDLPSIHPARAGVGGLSHRRSPADVGHRVRRMGSRKLLGRMVSPLTGHVVVVLDHLRLRRLRVAGVVPAGTPRLPVDVHEGRHHRAAGSRHPDRPPGHGGARGVGVRAQRHRPGLRRIAVPVPVHHHRLWRAVGLSCAGLLGDHPQAAPKGRPDAPDRLRRHADRVVRGDHGADRGGHPQSAPVLHAQCAGGPNRRHRRNGGRVCQQPSADRRSDHHRADQPSRRRRRPGFDRVPHRRRPDAGIRDVQRSCPRCSAATR